MIDPFALQRGSIIRTIRKGQNLTLKNLSERSGLSLSFISQLERGLTNPSINSLRKIAIVLNIPLSSFFEESFPVNGPVVRKSQRRVLINTNSRITYQLLSLDPNRKIEFLLTRLEVGSASAESPLAHKGEEAALVLEGECQIELGNQTHHLKEGDSIYISENTPHRLTNTGGLPLIVVSAISPPGF